MTTPPPGALPPGYGPAPAQGPTQGYGPPQGYWLPPGYGPRGYGPPPGWVPVRPTSTLAIVALVLVAVSPPVGLVLAWFALKETHPVTGSKGGRELATVALWVNLALSALVLLILGSVFVQLIGSLAFALPMIATAGG